MLYNNFYIRLPKTASSSLSKALTDTNTQILSVRKYNNKYLFTNDYKFIFTIVRNPYDFIVSVFLMVTHSEHTKTKIKELKDNFK